MRTCVLYWYASAALCAFGLCTCCFVCTLGAACVCLCVCCCVARLMCSVCAVSYVGGLRDEDQYLLRHSSPALEEDSPHSHLLAHLDCQDREELQRTLHRLENENRWGLSQEHIHIFTLVAEMGKLCSTNWISKKYEWHLTMQNMQKINYARFCFCKLFCFCLFYDPPDNKTILHIETTCYEYNMKFKTICNLF